MPGSAWLDGVLYTHDHADHSHGIDDLRQVAFNGHRRVDVYYDEATGKLLRSRFSYCFESPPASEYPPILKGHEIRAGETVKISGAGGRDRGVAVPPNPWLRARRSASASAASPIRRM